MVIAPKIRMGHRSKVVRNTFNLEFIYALYSKALNLSISK